MMLVSSGIKPQLTCSYISVRQTSQMQQIFSLLHQVSKRKKEKPSTISDHIQDKVADLQTWLRMLWTNIETQF